MLQNLIKILMFLTVLLMSTSSLHLNQNRIIPVELSTLNLNRRQQLQPSSLLNDHHHYHNNDKYHQERSIRDQEQNTRSQQKQQQHRTIKSIEIDDDDDFDLINSEYLPQFQQQHNQLQLQHQQQQQQQRQLQQLQQQQQQHPRIFHTQPTNLISSSSNNNGLPISSFFNSHNQFNDRYIGAALPSSQYDYRNYHNRIPSTPIFQQQHQQLQHQQEQLLPKQQSLPITTHYLIQHHPSLPLNIRGNADEGGGDSISRISYGNGNRDAIGIGRGAKEHFMNVGYGGGGGGGRRDDDDASSNVDRIDIDETDDSRILNDGDSRRVLTPDDIDSLMMLNDDIYNEFDSSEKFIKNSETIKNKNNGAYDSSSSSSRNSESGAMNSNEINNSNNRDSLSNSNININNQIQLQPPKALQELFQQQQQQQQQDKNDKQLRTDILQSKLASLGAQQSLSSGFLSSRNKDFNSNEQQYMNDGYISRIGSTGASGTSSSFSTLDKRIKEKEQKMRNELKKRQEQLKKVTTTTKTSTSKSEKQNKQREQKMQKDQQVNLNGDLLLTNTGGGIQLQQKDKELNLSKKQNQNNMKIKNNNKQQKRQQKKDLQQNKRNGGNNIVGNGGISANIPPVSHSIANQLMLRNTRGQRQYDVPQIECPSAMDGMERFACPSPDRQGRYRCIDDHVLCDGFIDCPEGEDEERSSCMFYKTTKAHLDVLADALLRWARGR